MTQENKELLLKDLCARLPYNTIVKTNTDNINVSFTWLELKKLVNGDKFMCKPYLRPMSSMTEEEKVQLSQYACIGEDLNGEFIDEVQRKDCAAYIDWLNAHHFDYRGLIEKGLAIEVTEENNPYKE